MNVLPQSDPGYKAPGMREITGGERPTRKASSRTSEKRYVDSRKDEGWTPIKPEASKCSLNHEGPQYPHLHPTHTIIIGMVKCLATINMCTFPFALFVSLDKTRFSTW